jgi:hypothetical protein
MAGHTVFPTESSLPPEGPFGYTLLRTANDAPADVEAFFLDKDCAVCHPRQLRELQGSMHTAAHTDPLYRSFAEAALREAGPKVYAYCSGCHSAAGVASGLIPGKHDEDLPVEARAGVTCDVCHSVSTLTGESGPWKEPANASFVLEQSRNKFSGLGEVAPNRRHTGERRDFFSKSEYCASCHTVIHPVNGMKIEHTYGEWKSSIYAQKGVQCQDCHMRTVADAVKVAETLQPVVVEGQSATEGPLRRIAPHYFVGGNTNAEELAGGKRHAAMAEERLKSAARVTQAAPARGNGKPMTLTCWCTMSRRRAFPPASPVAAMWPFCGSSTQRDTLCIAAANSTSRASCARSDSFRAGPLTEQEKTYKRMGNVGFSPSGPFPKGFSRTITVECLQTSQAITVNARLRYRSVSPLAAKNSSEIVRLRRRSSKWPNHGHDSHAVVLIRSRRASST